MATLEIKGNPKWKRGIPEDTLCKVEVLPARVPVFNQKVTKKVTLELDPGIYHILLQKYLGKNANNRHSMLRWEQTIFHDITKKEYEVLINLTPTEHYGRMTSDGFLFFCQRSGCGEKVNNALAAVLHECEHKGISREDLIKDSDMFIAENSDEVAATKRKTIGSSKSPSFTSDSIV